MLKSTDSSVMTLAESLTSKANVDASYNIRTFKLVEGTQIVLDFSFPCGTSQNELTSAFTRLKNVIEKVGGKSYTMYKNYPYLPPLSAPRVIGVPVTPIYPGVYTVPSGLPIVARTLSSIYDNTYYNPYLPCYGYNCFYPTVPDQCPTGILHIGVKNGEIGVLIGAIKAL